MFSLWLSLSNQRKRKNEKIRFVNGFNKHRPQKSVALNKDPTNKSKHLIRKALSSKKSIVSQLHTLQRQLHRKVAQHQVSLSVYE